MINTCFQVDSSSNFWKVIQVQGAVRKESLPPLKNTTRKSGAASGANFGLVPRARIAGCWMRTYTADVLVERWNVFIVIFDGNPHQVHNNQILL